MDTIIAIISGVIPVLAGLNIFQFISIRSLKKKANAEADKITAEAEQEGAKADGLNLENIRSLLELQGKQLLEAEKRNGELSKENDILRQKLREYDYKLEQFERKIKGMERIISSEIARRSYAEHHICLNLDCKNRKPGLGEFKLEGK